MRIGLKDAVEIFHIESEKKHRDIDSSTLQYDEQGSCNGSTPTDEFLIEEQNHCCSGCHHHLDYSLSHRIDDFMVCKPCHNRYLYGDVE